MNDSTFGIGTASPRVEDARLLQGRGRYAADVALPGQAYLHVLRSPHAHAKLGTIDSAAARAAPGVLAVLTGAEVAADRLGSLPANTGRRRADGSPTPVPQRPLLAQGTVRHIGDPVAAVVAESLAQAIDAAELIEIDYAPLPAVTTAAAARADGAPLVWPDAPGNIAFVVAQGDRAAVERSFAAAHHIARLDFAVSRVTAAPLEPRAALGLYDPGDERFIIHTGVQGPHQLKSLLASAIFKVPEHRVRVVVRDVGGSFGMKGGLYAEFALVLWAARRLGRPVRWTSERGEAFLADEHARDNLSRVELALDREGKFLALKLDALLNIGAYPSPRSGLPVNNIGGVAGVYTTPHIAATATGVFTHTQLTTPYRGSGRPEASYAIERVIDIAAAELGFDRVSLRRRNLIPAGAMPFKTGLVFTYDCGEFEEVMDETLALADWAGFERRRTEAKARGKLRGIGIANAIEVAGGPYPTAAPENAELRAAPDGSLSLMIGTQSSGQGHETAYAQIVAGRLGVAPERIRVLQGDTDVVAAGRGSGGSRSLAVGGSAVSLAVDKVIAKGKLFAVHLLEAAVEDIEFAGGKFTVAGTDRAVDLASVVKAAFDPLKIPAGVEPGLAESAGFLPSTVTFPNGCHISELEIDPATGATQILRYSVVDDVGRVMNPLLLKGQIHGGVTQGLGQALLEAIRYEPATGQLLSGSFMDYAMPRAADLPLFAVESHAVPTAVNPLGAKGAGEAGTVGALPCVINAVVDALAPLGLRHIDMPATPERIWRAIRAARG